MEKMPIHFLHTLVQPPAAVARVFGSREYPELYGRVRFFRTAAGVLVAAEFVGLPTGNGECDKPVFAMHIHEGQQCAPEGEDPFGQAGTHFNPDSCPHPAHGGDLPPLLGCGGLAIGVFLTDRFTVEDVLGKTVILHRDRDDFTTQPSGASGAKIACGKILPWGRAGE